MCDRDHAEVLKFSKVKSACFVYISFRRERRQSCPKLKTCRTNWRTSMHVGEPSLVAWSLRKPESRMKTWESQELSGRNWGQVSYVLTDKYRSLFVKVKSYTHSRIVIMVQMLPDFLKSCKGYFWGREPVSGSRRAAAVNDIFIIYRYLFTHINVIPELVFHSRDLGLKNFTLCTPCSVYCMFFRQINRMDFFRV